MRMSSCVKNLALDSAFQGAVRQVFQFNQNQLRYAYIYTFGCQMNVHESEIFTGILMECGYLQAGSPEQADVILINTCCIREHAEQKILGLLGTLRELKEKKPELIIGLCGCMTQQRHFSEKIRSRFPYVDIVLGTNAADKLPEAVLKALTEQGKAKKTVFLEENDNSILENAPTARARSVTSWLTIMYGCNNFCTYCIVPYVRGRERSRDSNAILSEAQQLVKEGTKEITLLGQNVNSYGKELNESFAHLLRQMNQIDGLERIRFMTSHPKDISDEVIDAFAQCGKVCEHLHLPLQSGSSRILQAMNRHYDAEKYWKIVEKLRTAQPKIEISTDIIVGFPGETEEDFQQTLEFVERMRYSFAFMFAFSPRKGTKAADMEGQVPNEVKKERLQRLIELQNQISTQISRDYIGKTVEILSEGFCAQDEEEAHSAKDPLLQVGRTRTNKKVYFSCEEDTQGKLLQMDITNSATVTLNGKVVNR